MIFTFAVLVLQMICLTSSGDVENPLVASSVTSPSPGSIIIPQSEVQIFTEQVHPNARDFVYILTELGFIDPDHNALEQFNEIVFENRTFAAMTLGMCFAILIIGLVVKFGTQ